MRVRGNTGTREWVGKCLQGLGQTQRVQLLGPVEVKQAGCVAESHLTLVLQPPGLSKLLLV